MALPYVTGSSQEYRPTKEFEKKSCATERIHAENDDSTAIPSRPRTQRKRARSWRQFDGHSQRDAQARETQAGAALVGLLTFDPSSWNPSPIIE
jgi:hypothetical protein